MSKEVYKLLKEYEEKELDDDFIYTAFDMMMEKEDIDDYIKGFNVVSKNGDTLGAYANEKEILLINRKRIEEDKLIPNKKILALQVLRHELEHAKNLKKLYEEKEDIESKVIRYSLREYAMNHGLYYGSNLDKVDSFTLQERRYGTYDIDPGERIAEIKSWKYIVNLLKNQKDTKDLLTARSMLYYSYARGYNNNRFYLEPPTYEYLLKLGLYHEHDLLRKQINNSFYSFDTRLTYGLPISNAEYIDGIFEKVKIKKKTN